MNEYRELVKQRIVDVFADHDWALDSPWEAMAEAITSEEVFGPMAIPVIQSVVRDFELGLRQDGLTLEHILSYFRNEIHDARIEYGLEVAPEPPTCDEYEVAVW